MKSVLSRTAVFGAVAMMCPWVAYAEPSAALDRVSVWLGGYMVDFDAKLSAEDPSRNLSVSDQPILTGQSKVWRARVDMLLMDSQGLSLDYFRIHQGRQYSIQRSFQADGVTYDANGAAAYDTKLDVGNLSYRFWMGSGDTVFGFGVGAQYYALDTVLSGNASVSGVGTYTAVSKQSTSGVAPLLTLGWRTRLSEQWRVYADASGAKYSKDGQSGSIVNGAIGLEY